MNTTIFKDNLNEAARLLQEGELVAVPTETVYGLAGNGLDEKAVQAIYEVKGRPAVKPLSLMVPDVAAMDRYCEDIPSAARKLAESFWPGPLTIVLRARDCVPDLVRAGGNTVGLRCPDHPLTLSLLKLAGVPLAAPSANPSGEESPRDAARVLDYFEGKIAGVIDGGPCGIGTESTLIDMSSIPYRILRQGALEEEKIRAALLDGLCIIGLTGPSGSGKTTALKELEKQGAYVIDCDELYHSILGSRKDMLSEIDREFPGMVKDGVLDRRALAMVVFSSFAKLDRLNEITHKYIVLEVRDRLSQWAMEGGRLAAVDAVELISSGLAELCTATVGILAEEELRVDRIMLRDELSDEEAQMRVEAQKDEEYYRSHCTHILENNGKEAEFIRALTGIIQEVTKHG